MPHYRSATLLVVPLFFSAFLAFGQVADSDAAQNSSASAADNKPAGNKSAEGQPPAPTAPPIPRDAPRMSKQTRLQIIRDFETQLIYARTAFPMGTKGLHLKEGVITPNGEELRQVLTIFGPSIKPGDPAHISFVQIKDEHIHFEINGGPVHRQKWYQHIQISGAGGTAQAPQNDPQANPHGSFVDVHFGKYVPEMTAQQLRTVLYPVFDFNARNKEQAYLDTVPPKAKAAIQAHHVLVGMNQKMVVHAMGRPPKKVREREGETIYEEWIYGEPPADVDFVRLVGDEVVRVETMKVGGEKIVRTEKEIVLQPVMDREAKEEPEMRPANAPTMRRPGEDTQDVPTPADGPIHRPASPPPDISGPGGPGSLASGQE
jgi:hypothetical protein